MKKLVLIILAVFLIFSSCQDPFLSAPALPANDVLDGAALGSSNVPKDLSASHGEKRTIYLSWNSVNNAALYYIYSADSPLNDFERCGETSLTNSTFKVSPGSTVYYRVSSVSHDGTESNKSNYVVGTSLAQPIISDITDISEESASVTWYMENGAAYRDKLLYIVYCFNNNTELDQKLLDASKISENRVVFTGLNANTRYEYQVEAYLSTDQSASEKSDKMDAATARRFRPGAPEHLKAAHGTATNKIDLTFDLPDMVDIALGDNTYDPKPLYFTVSKRLYSESGNNEYQLVCAYLGTEAGNAAGKTGGLTFSGYIPGTSITWTDTAVMRGVKYEYQVQSYVDNTNRIISSDSSRAAAVGWTLSEGSVSYGKTVYILNPEGSLYAHAEMPVSLSFDYKNETYEYTIVAKVEPIDDGNSNNPNAAFEIRKSFNYEETSSYAFQMDLTQKSSADKLGRGVYSVEVEVKLPGGSVPIDTFKALGQIQISEDTQPIVVENFHIQDGYKDKFVLIWDNYLNRRYKIERSDNGQDPWIEIDTINDNPNDDDITVFENYKYTVSGQQPNVTRYFRIRPARSIGSGAFKDGQRVYAPAAKTLGIPELSLGSEVKSYSVITPHWTEAQKADTYRIKYRYTEGSAEFKVASTVKKEDIAVDAGGKFKYSFKPEGYNNAAQSGKEIQIEIEALNEKLRTENGSKEEIFTSSSEDVRTRLVGPALLDVTASKAVAVQDVNVSWNHIEGAGGYYVFRRQFNMTNNAEEGTEAVVYYIPAPTSTPIIVTGKYLVINDSNSKEDTETVKATASYTNSRYTLKDSYLTDNEYDASAYRRHSSVYRDQQNDMIQGFPYRYFVIPVIGSGPGALPLNAVDFIYNRDGSNKNTSIDSYSVRDNTDEIKYTGAAALEREGFTVGFGQNVTATKGTYASSGNVNDGIRVTWSAPPRLSTAAGFTPRYTVYRRTAAGSQWSPVTSVENTSIVDTPQERGVAYEYAVGISNAGNNASVPHNSRRFIESCVAQRDERNRLKMLGYMLSQVKMESVSRNELRDSLNNLAEEVRWYSGGISNSYNSDERNWGVDGYDVFVMNRNIDANWHRIADMTNIPNEINVKIMVSNVKGGDTLEDGLLKVLRDYKHFFKVRSYVKNEDNEKIYCPDPQWTYQYRWGTNSAAHIAASEQMQNDYVKWGARQVTANEFIRISTLYVARGLSRVNGNAWNTGYWARTENASTSRGGSGSIKAESNFGVTEWELTFSNYKDDLQVRTNNEWMTFITVNGRTRARTSATNQFPQRYREWNANTPEWLDIIGPWDTPSLYTGKIRIGTGTDNAANNLHWGSGRISIQYPNGTATQDISWRGEDTPLPFSGRGNDRFEQDAWK